MRSKHGVLAIAVIAGCSWTTSSTERRTVFGYDHRPRVALMTHGTSDLIDAWTAALRGEVDLVATSALVDEKPDDLHTRMCTKARELAQAGTTVDEVLVIRTAETSEKETKCLRWGNSKSILERLGSDDDDDDGRYCAKSRYESTTAKITADIRHLDATTCRPTRRLGVTSNPYTARGDETGDPLKAREVAGRIHAADARRLAPTLFPSGLTILGVDGRRIEVSRRGDRELALGNIYVVRGQSPGKPGALGRVRVASLQPDRATLEAETDYLGVGVNDELRAHTIGHRWTLYGALTGGVLRDDSGSHRVWGIGAAVRWVPNRWPIVAEADVIRDASTDLKIARTSFGTAWGMRWPLGPVAPLALLELGYTQADQTDTAGRDAISLGWYRGAGAGVELWIGRVFVLADARYRRLSTGGWKTPGEMSMPTTVPHDDRHVTQIFARISAGYRY